MPGHNLDLTVVSVRLECCRPVRYSVSAADLLLNFSERSRQIICLAGKDRSATGLVAECFEPCVPRRTLINFVRAYAKNRHARGVRGVHRGRIAAPARRVLTIGQ